MSPQKDLLTDLLFEDISERRYLQILFEQANPIDSFKEMVNYNVSLFVLKKLWPVEYNRIRQNRYYSAYAAAEPGWGGRAGNMESWFDPENHTGHLNKNHILAADAIYALCRNSRQKADYIITRLDFAQLPGLQKREEASLSVEQTAGRLFHYRSQGSFDTGDFAVLSSAEYKKVAMHLVAREVTSFAVAAAGMLIDHGMATSTIESKAEEIIELRASGSLRELLRAVSVSKNVLVFFYDNLNSLSLVSQSIKNNRAFLQKIRDLFTIEK